MIVDRATWGQIYLFHFDRPLGNLANPRGQAQHYLGWALDAEARIATHLAGQGAKIVAAAIAAGIVLTPYIIGGAPKEAEWIIKTRIKQTACFCPACCTTRRRRPRPLPYHLVQLALPLDDDFPEPPPLTMDSYEFLTLRRWRSSRVSAIDESALARLDSLL